MRRPQPSVEDRARTLKMYNWLSQHNPHLPPADMVASDPGITLRFGPGRASTLEMNVYVEVPDAPVLEVPLEGYQTPQLDQEVEQHEHADGAA